MSSNTLSYSDFLKNACFGNAACQAKRDEAIRAQSAQNRLNELARLAAIDREKAEVEARKVQTELEAKARESEIRLQEMNVKLAETERMLREKEALQKIEFQAKMGDAAVDRATGLNKAELAQNTAETAMYDEQTIMRYGAIGGAALLVFIVILFMFK